MLCDVQMSHISDSYEVKVLFVRSFILNYVFNLESVLICNLMVSSPILNKLKMADKKDVGVNYYDETPSTNST